MGYEIERQIIPGLPDIPLTATNLVVAHESGNPNNTGEDALENEISYMTDNWRNAFTSHWVGGGGRIVQLAETGLYQYGAGGKANPVSYAHVELARTDNKEQFEQDYKAYVWLLHHLAKEAGIPTTLDSSDKRGIKSHLWVTKNLGGTTHVDPYGYLAQFGISKAQFKKDVEGGAAYQDTSTPEYSTNTATVKESAETYATGENISSWVKGNTYTIIQEESDRVLLEEIYSWVRKSDIEEFDEPEVTQVSNPVSNVDDGDTVTLSSSASRYATGEIISSKYKGKTYTVIQEKSDRVLLKELYSWVNKSDLVGAKPAPSKPVSSPGINGKVVLKGSASRYATGESIPASVKGKTYTVQQEESNKVLLKEILSWVRKADISPVGKAAPKPVSFKEGNKVSIVSHAKRYATGENIPSRFKGNRYTIQQVKSDRVLLKELVSWVYKSDLK